MIIAGLGKILGFLLIIILAVLFGFATGSYVSYLGVLVVGVIAGYLVNDKSKDRIIPGIIRGLIAGLLMALIGIIITLMIVNYTGTAKGYTLGIGGIIYVMSIYGIIGAIGGAIGDMIVTEG